MYSLLDDQFAARLGRRSAGGLKLALLAGFTACAGAPQGRLDGHRVDLRSMELGGHTRSFLVAPGIRRGSAPQPLLLIYHGSEGTAQAILDQTALGIAGIEAGMVVASLDAVPGYGGRWATNPADLRVVDDVQFTREVIRSIARDIRIDSTRIFAVGYSRGGDFVYQLACREPRLVRGVAAVSATLLHTNRAWCDSTANAPSHPATSIVLGSADPLMPWNGGLANRAGALETATYFAQRSSCGAPLPDDSLAARRTFWTVTRTRFASCAKGDVALYRVAPLEHVWAGIAFDVERTLVNSFLALPRR